MPFSGRVGGGARGTGAHYKNIPIFGKVRGGPGGPIQKMPILEGWELREGLGTREVPFYKKTIF